MEPGDRIRLLRERRHPEGVDHVVRLEVEQHVASQGHAKRVVIRLAVRIGELVGKLLGRDLEPERVSSCTAVLREHDRAHDCNRGH